MLDSTKIFEYYDKKNEIIYDIKIDGSNLSENSISHKLLQASVGLTDIESLRKSSAYSKDVTEKEITQIHAIINNGEKILVHT